MSNTNLNSRTRLLTAGLRVAVVVGAAAVLSACVADNGGRGYDGYSGYNSGYGAYDNAYPGGGGVIYQQQPGYRDYGYDRNNEQRAWVERDRLQNERDRLQRERERDRNQRERDQNRWQQERQNDALRQQQQQQQQQQRQERERAAQQQRDREAQQRRQWEQQNADRQPPSGMTQKDINRRRAEIEHRSRTREELGH